MTEEVPFDMRDDFDFLLTFLPCGWEEKAKELGALRRCRKIPNAQVLLRLLLIHLAEGCSLRETAARAKHGGLIAVSDVAIMERLAVAGEWFRWMSTQLAAQWWVRPAEPVFTGPWQVRVIDATVVKEPGPTGSCWRIHYALSLPALCCTELYVTDSAGSGTGEGFTRFAVAPGDLFLGDRAYGRAGDVAHVVQAGGAVITRFAWSALPLWVNREQRFDLWSHLRSRRGSAPGDWPAQVEHQGKLIPGRVCAVKRSRQAAEQAQRQACRKAQKNGGQVAAETLEAAQYVFVFTTLTAQQLGPAQVLEFYRGRWQVELVFKRLKSILALGHLHKQDEQAARAWLHGKLFVALLIEAMLRAAETFSPWGYPLCDPAGTEPVSVARGSLHAASLPAGGQSRTEPA
jgi:hypothetical protein